MINYYWRLTELCFLTTMINLILIYNEKVQFSLKMITFVKPKANYLKPMALESQIIDNENNFLNDSLKVISSHQQWFSFICL